MDQASSAHDAELCLVAPVAVTAFCVRDQYWCPSFVGMSVDHGVYNSPESERPVFLDVVPGMTVIVRCDHQVGVKQGNDHLLKFN